LLQIRKVAVLGAGTMGARIAAHLANAQVPCVLLDIVPSELTPQEQSKGLSLSDPQLRNRIAQAGLDGALKSRPAAFFVPESAQMISVGNFEDHLSQLKDCDWIIEAVTEDLEVKRALLRQVESVRAPRAVVSSNTSGISIAAIADGFSADFRRYWLGTHFFNPPRYMKLLEIIPIADTLPEVIQTVSQFGDVVLGKGIVTAKDTPNFIANRIGTFVTMNVLRVMQQDGYSIEEIDALTGPAMGLPKSATFRTLDIVGLDVLVHVVRNLARSLPNDEKREVFEMPEFVNRMLERKMLGDKTKQGFYKKTKGAGDEGSEIQTLDLKNLEYRPRQKAHLAALEMAANIEDPRQRVATLIQSSDRAGKFYQKVLSDAFHYAATRIPEISDDIVSVDNAMKWGFNWEAGPFELLDAVGVGAMAEKWRKENRPVPLLVEKLLGAGRKTFYEDADAITRVFDFSTGTHKALEPGPGVILLPSLKATQREIRKNAGASLIDLGDGVLCLEFHSKMNSIGA